MISLNWKVTSQFSLKAMRSEDCWYWTGSINKSGYGYLITEKKIYIAHRIAYFLEYGPFDESAKIHHKCENRHCVKPQHLFIENRNLYNEPIIEKETIKQIVNTHVKTPTIEMSPYDQSNFLTYVLRGEGCWYWTGAKDALGYGRFGIKGKIYLAHRIAFQIANGYLDETADICHSCDYPSCVNPAHLFEGTRKENMQDCKSKGRHSYGESRPLAKLTEVEVIKIRLMYAQGWSQRKLAHEFNISRWVIQDIIQKKTWTHI